MDKEARTGRTFGNVLELNLQRFLVGVSGATVYVLSMPGLHGELVPDIPEPEGDTEEHSPE